MSSWTRGFVATLLLLIVLVAGGWSFARRYHSGTGQEFTDFAGRITPTDPAFVAALPPITPARIRQYRIPVINAKVQVANGVEYDAWTFGGTVPGPIIHAREGDLVRVNFVNQGSAPHSIDFHAQRTAMQAVMRDIMPGDSLSFEFTARDPGAFMVHCTTQPVLLHVMQGMYLPMIVEPAGGWGTEADAEFVLVQGEFYARDEKGAGVKAARRTEGDWGAALDKQASYVVFNGRAFQYRDHPLRVKLGDRVRLFVINAGPSFVSNFHIVGAVFDRVYPGGRPEDVVRTVQTWPIPPGGSAVFETVFDATSGAGLYPFVTHSFADAFKGGTGAIEVDAPATVAARPEHPR